MSKEQEIEKLVDEIVDVIHSYQSELSDGFGYYDSFDTWDRMKKDLKEVLKTKE